MAPTADQWSDSMKELKKDLSEPDRIYKEEFFQLMQSFAVNYPDWNIKQFKKYYNIPYKKYYNIGERLLRLK